MNKDEKEKERLKELAEKTRKANEELKKIRARNAAEAKLRRTQEALSKERTKAYNNSAIGRTINQAKKAYQNYEKSQSKKPKSRKRSSKQDGFDSMFSGGWF